MRKWVIISGLLFTIGNATWRYFEIEKIFWLPLGLFLWIMVIYVMQTPKDGHPVMKMFLAYLALLASGNIIKQAFYQDNMLQINDYIWGAVLTLILLISIIAWMTQKHKNGGKV